MPRAIERWTVVEGEEETQKKVLLDNKKTCRKVEVYNTERT
jgi:hypothetical protein